MKPTTRQLKDIPNQDGYELWGILYDGSLVECVIRAGTFGLHQIVRRSDRQPMYHSLKGWFKSNEVRNRV
jgi:hypothetical protein